MMYTHGEVVNQELRAGNGPDKIKNGKDRKIGASKMGPKSKTPHVVSYRDGDPIDLDFSVGIRGHHFPGFDGLEPRSALI